MVGGNRTSYCIYPRDIQHPGCPFADDKRCSDCYYSRPIKKEQMSKDKTIELKIKDIKTAYDNACADGKKIIKDMCPQAFKGKGKDVTMECKVVLEQSAIATDYYIMNISHNGFQVAYTKDGARGLLALSAHAEGAGYSIELKNEAQFRIMKK